MHRRFFAKPIREVEEAGTAAEKISLRNSGCSKYTFFVAELAMAKEVDVRSGEKNMC